MNYHYIKNFFELVEHNFPDIFDIRIYYLNETYCQINIKRRDSTEGWGLEMELRLFDIERKNFNIIYIGPSQENIKSIIYKSNFELYYDNETKIIIEDIILPRNEKIMINKYKVLKDSNLKIDLHIVIYYLEDYKIKIIIRRLDEEYGWDDDFDIIIFDKEKKNRKEIIHINKSIENYKYLFLDTKIQIIHEEDYIQEIPKIIFQTGFNNRVKNILHFNSIISFIELNPEYKYIYYNNINSRKFLRENFSDEINYSYDMLVPGAYKADLLRYCFLYHYGGCYFDCKQILKIPIKKFLDKSKTLVLCNDVIENALLNAIIFSTKKNIILEKTIKDCVYNIIHKLGTSALDITGPIFFYKSIKKYINKDNVILQNNRPPDDFSDFSKDYYNNNITLISNKSVIVNRFYKEYYMDYINTNHYGKLFTDNEIYYKNIKKIGEFKICVYPNPFPDKFDFNIVDNKLTINRTDSKEGWNLNLKLLIINLNNCDEILIEVGNSVNNKKEIIL
jgi:mannosyltransferase OCH1-like enzyme